VYACFKPFVDVSSSRSVEQTPLAILSRLACQGWSIRLTCPDWPVLTAFSRMYLPRLYCRGCPATVVLSQLSCLSSPVLSCSGHPVVSFLRLSSFPYSPLQLSCPACLIPALLPPSSSVSAVLSMLSSSGWPVYPSCPCYPVTDVLSSVSQLCGHLLPFCPLLLRGHQLPCPDYPALSFLFWLSCRSCLLSVLPRLYCPSCSVLSVMFWPSSPFCPVPAVLPKLSCPDCHAPSVL
jgi:hypothetical protein